MAEVKLSVIGKHTFTYTDNAALITASIAPPSLTFVDNTTQVTIAKDSIAVITYTDNSEVELEGNLKREVAMNVELEGRMERIVDSQDPFKYSISGDLRRDISNTVELNYQLEREVLSFNVGLEYEIRRIVTNDIELSGQIQRNISAGIELEGSLCRIIKSDDEDDPRVPDKDYGSFIDKNKLFRVQHDVLDENVSDNPYFNLQISNLQNAALLTKNQTVIKAINELFIEQKELFLTTYNSITKLNGDIGDVVVDSELRNKFNKLGYENIKSAIIGLSSNIDIIIKFIGSQAEEIDKYNEFGYNNLIDALMKISAEMKDISYNWDDWNEEEVEWIFRTKDYIADIRDTVMDMINSLNDEITQFEQRVADKFIYFANGTDRQMERYHQAFLAVFNDCDDITDPEIRRIFYYLAEGEEIEESEDPVAQLVVSLGRDLADYKLQVTKALTALGDDLYDVSDATEREIRAIFSQFSVIIDEDTSFEDSVLDRLKELDNALNELSNEYKMDMVELKDTIIANVSDRLDLLQRTHDRDISIINTKFTDIDKQLVYLRDLHLKDVGDIEDTITDIKLSISNATVLHQSDIKAINEKIAEIENTHATDIDRIDNDLDDIRDSIITLETKHDNDMSTIQVELETHYNLIQALDNNITNLENKHDSDLFEVSETLTAHATNLNRLNNKTKSLEEKHDSDVTNINSILNTYYDEINNIKLNHESDMQIIRSTMESQTTIIQNDILRAISEIQDELDAYITSADERFDNIESDIEVIKTENANQEESLEDLDYRVSILEIRILFPDIPVESQDEELSIGEVSNLYVISEDEIGKMFSSDSQLDNTVKPYKETIDEEFDFDDSAIVSEEDIMDLFKN